MCLLGRQGHSSLFHFVWGGWSRTVIRKVSGADLSICLFIFGTETAHRPREPWHTETAHWPREPWHSFLFEVGPRTWEPCGERRFQQTNTLALLQHLIRGYDGHSQQAIGHAFQAGLVCHCWLVCLALASLAWQVAMLGFQSQACMCEVGWFECG